MSINITINNTVCNLTTVSLRELSANYIDNQELGVTALNGNLCVRPAYQREFVYNDTRKIKVIDSILNGVPLGLMHWHDKGNGTFDVIDGQQRTISICQFINGDYSIMFDGNTHYFHTLPADIRERILNYNVMVNKFSGTESEVLKLFKDINVPGMALTDQELRNSAYTGTWLSSAKVMFSKTNCAAQEIGGDYINGSANRQELLECALYWITGCSEKDKPAEIEAKITSYMSKHRNDKNANELWEHFMNVIEWVEKVTEGATQKELICLGEKWGELYAQYHDTFVIDNEAITEKRKELWASEWVIRKGIFPYIISGDLRYVNPRSFDKKMKSKKYKEQKGICPVCGKKHKESEMEADHITPWADGGITEYSNLQMLCKECNHRKGSGLC